MSNEVSSEVRSGDAASSSSMKWPIYASAPPTADMRERLISAQRAENPLLEAADLLLGALADLPGYAGSDGGLPLRMLLEQELRIFERLCEQANIRRDHMIGARYCLCTALDEMAMQTAWGQGGENGVAWNTNSLASAFHEDSEGGNKIYLLIGRLMKDPDEHIDLLEVIYRILSLGFEGRYRHEPDGARKHRAIRQRLYDEIMVRREPVPIPVSPHWQSNVPGKPKPFYDFPVWITVVVLSLILLVMVGYFKYELLNRSAAVQKQIAAIAQMVPPQASASTVHLKELLKGEIAAGTVSVNEDAHHSSVTFRGDTMFAPGGASVRATMSPLIAKIAAEVAKVPGKVTIVGYTDNVPIRSSQFASNQALSEARAKQMAQMLQAAGVPPSRLDAVGRGEADPIGDNSTAQGRAQNRRVEITVAE